MIRSYELSGSELLLVAQAGALRQIENIKNKVKQAYGADSLGDWQKNIEGAAGEFVLAKHLGLFWGGKGILRAPDVGGIHEARTTALTDGRLIIHKDDADDHYFWLITGINGMYFVRGCILGRLGKQDKWWSDPTKQGRWAYFVPITELKERAG